MKTEDSTLSSLFLFNNLSANEINESIRSISPITKVFERGECIYSPQSFEKSIGFLMSGECVVQKRSIDDKFTPLNIIRKGESFGILAALTGRDHFPTYIYAKNQCKIIFITAPDLECLIKSNPTISINVIKFLAHKVEFLNDKISTFSGDNSEQKIASYILQLYRSSNSPSFDFNKKRAAETLNLGRASLYRSLDKLTEAGLIEFEGKKIYITDPEGLERKTK